MSYPIGKHEENEKLKREIAYYEKVIMILKEGLCSIANESGSYTKEGLGWVANNYLNHVEALKRDAICPVSERSERDMEIAEAVRKACSNRSFDAEITYRIHGIDLAAIVKGVK